MKAKTAFRDLRDLKREAVNRISQELSDEELFLSDETKQYVNTLAKTITGRYANSAIQVNMVFDPNSEFTGYTSGNSITLNAGSSRVSTFRSLADRMMRVSGTLYHELAHCVYLDFAEMKKAKSEMKQGVFYGGFPVLLSDEEKDDLARLQVFLKNPAFSNMIIGIYHSYLNILSDEHDERALIRSYGDYEKQCILMLKNQIRIEEHPYEDYCKAMMLGKFPISTFFNDLLLTITRLGKITVIDPSFVDDDEIYQDLMSLKDIIEDAVEHGSSADLIPVANYMLLKLWPYLEFEIWQTAQMMRQAQDQSQSQSKSQSGNGQSKSQTGSQGQAQNQDQSGPQSQGQKRSGTQGQPQAQNGAWDQERGGQGQTSNMQTSSSSQDPTASGRSDQQADQPKSGGENGGMQQSGSQQQSAPQNASSILNHMGFRKDAGSATGNASENGQQEDGNSSGQTMSNGNDSSTTGQNAQSDSGSQTGRQTGSDRQAGQGHGNNTSQGDIASAQNETSSSSGTDQRNTAGGGQNAAAQRMNEIEDMLNGMTEQERDQLAQSIADQLASDLSNAMTTTAPERSANRTSPASKKRSPQKSVSGSQGDAGDTEGQGDSKQKTSSDVAQNGNQTVSSAASKSSAHDTGAASETGQGHGDENSSASGSRDSATQGQTQNSHDDPAQAQAQNQAESIVSQLIRQIAEKLADMEVEKASGNELLTLAREAGFSSSHKDYPCRIVRKMDQKNKTEYDRIASQQRSLLNSMVRQMERVFKDMQTGNVKPHQVVGTQFRASDAHRLDGQCFITKKASSDKPDIAITVLVDKSGSMDGSRIRAAQKAAVLIYDFCQKLKIPCMVCGHSIPGTRGGGMLFEIFSDFRSLSDDKYRVAAGLNSAYNACNRDGMALQIAGHLLEKRPEPVKLLIIISDGQPSDSGYTGKAAEQDIRETVKKASRKKINTIAFAIGDDNENKRIKEIYGNNYVDASDLAALPKKLARLVRRFVLASMT